MVMSLWPCFLAHPVGIRATTLWDPWDASPPTLEIVGTKCIFGPLQLLQPAVIFRWALREAYIVLPQTSLLNLRGRKDKWGREWVKHRCSYNGRRGRGGGGKGTGSASVPRDVLRQCCITVMTHCLCVCCFRDLYPFIYFNEFVITMYIILSVVC